MPKAKVYPSVETLREMFDYNPDTGELRWKVDRGWKVKAGHIAGYKQRRGYYVVGIMKKHYQLHRIIYTLYYGETLQPDDHIDHINRDPSDNRIANLRKVKCPENQHNRKLSSPSGCKRVCYDKRRKNWRARLRVNDVVYSLGSYKTFEEAVEARKQAETDHGLIC